MRPKKTPGCRRCTRSSCIEQLAPWSGRAIAFLVDCIASALVTALFVRNVNWERNALTCLVLWVEHVVLVGLTGQTLGMRMLGYKVLRLADVTRPPGWAAAVLRTIPLALTVGLVGFFTTDGRGLHDVAAGSAVVRD